MKDFYQKISLILEQVIKDKYGLALEDSLWEVPAKQEFGDLSTMAAMKLASKVKKAPLEIAAGLEAGLKKELKTHVDKIEVMRPGFVNVFFSKETLVESLSALITRKEAFFRHNIKKRILIEFASANPTGPLSIAHGRQAVVGDTIANILEFFGNTVDREYYINDEGRQIEILVESVKARIKEINNEPFQFPEKGYKGGYIKDVAQEYLSKKKRGLRGFVLKYLLSLIKNDLAKLGVRFDSWLSQHRIIADKKVEKAVTKLRKKKLLYEEGGALWFKSTEFGDDKDRVIRKADGQLTYFASDIAYHQDKIGRRYHKLIDLWGPDHHGYIRRLKAAIFALTRKKDILKVIIVQLVTLKTKAKMSKRAGTLVLLSDLVKDVGKDAARFYYLTRRNSSHLEFDIDLAKKTSYDNPLYYIQYACARIASIFRKGRIKSFDAKNSRLLSNDQEIRLLRFILQFSFHLQKAYCSLEPVFLIEYLKELASYFHQFYERVRVLEGPQDIKSARLNLLQAAKIVLHCGLGLLGIKPAEKM